MRELASGVVAPPPAPAPLIRQPSQAPRYGLATGAVACAGVFTIIAVLALASFNVGVLLLLGSFGSTAVMMFTFPELHFSQPRSVIGGHFICTAVGLAALALLGPSWWSLATAAAVSAALMMLTRCMPT